MKKQTYTDYLFLLIIVAIWAIPGFIGIGAYRLYNKYHKQKNNPAVLPAPVKQASAASDEKALEEFENGKYDDIKQNDNEIVDIPEQETDRNIEPAPEKQDSKLVPVSKPEIKPDQVEAKEPAVTIIEAPAESKPLATRKIGGVRTREDYDTEHDQLMAVQMRIMKQLME